MKARLLTALTLAGICAAGCAPRWDLDQVPLPGFQASDEEQIRAVLIDVRRGMENRQPFRILAHVSRGYQDPNGRTYQDLYGYFEDFFERYRNIRIERVRPRILVLGDHAQVLDTFATIAEPLDPTVDVPLNVEGQVYIYLDRIDGRWRIVSWDSAQPR